MPGLWVGEPSRQLYDNTGCNRSVLFFSFLLHLTVSCTARQKPTPDFRGRSAFYWLKIVFCRSGFREKGLPRQAIRNRLLLCTHLTLPPTNRRLCCTNRRLRCTNRRLRCTNRRLRCITLTRLPPFTQRSKNHLRLWWQFAKVGLFRGFSALPAPCRCRNYAAAGTMPLPVPCRYRIVQAVGFAGGLTS